MRQGEGVHGGAQLHLPRFAGDYPAHLASNDVGFFEEEFWDGAVDHTAISAIGSDVARRGSSSLSVGIETPFLKPQLLQADDDLAGTFLHVAIK